MSYQLAAPLAPRTDTNVVIRTNADGSITSIPFDPDNTDYQAYLAWVAAGNVAAPAGD